MRSSNKPNDRVFIVVWTIACVSVLVVASLAAV